MVETQSFGDWLQGTFQNTLSRVVDMELREEYAPNDPVPVTKAEGTPGASTIEAGKPSTANLGGLALSPALIIGAGVLLVVVLMLARRS